MQVNMDNLVWHENSGRERAHYSKRTVDVEYKYPFGIKNCMVSRTARILI